MNKPVVPMSDELWADLTKQALEQVDGGLLVMNSIQFRVAIVNAYKRGYEDGWEGKK